MMRVYTNPVVGLKKRPPHQNSLTQRLIYQSMRKKRKVECKTFSKPTLNIVSMYQENLSKAEEEVCGVCFREDDHDIQQNINGISCNKCRTLNVLILRRAAN